MRAERGAPRAGFGGKRRPGRGGGRVSRPQRRGLGDSSAPAARVRSGAAQRRGRPKGTSARGFYREAGEATRQGGWKSVGPRRWVVRSKGLGEGLSSESAGAAQPTFGEENFLQLNFGAAEPRPRRDAPAGSAWRAPSRARIPSFLGHSVRPRPCGPASLTICATFSRAPWVRG